MVNFMSGSVFNEFAYLWLTLKKILFRVDFLNWFGKFVTYAVDVVRIVGLHVNENQVLVGRLCEPLLVYINRMISNNKNFHKKIKWHSIVATFKSHTIKKKIFK